MSRFSYVLNSENTNRPYRPAVNPLPRKLCVEVTPTPFRCSDAQSPRAHASRHSPLSNPSSPNGRATPSSSNYGSARRRSPSRAVKRAGSAGSRTAAAEYLQVASRPVETGPGRPIVRREPVDPLAVTMSNLAVRKQASKPVVRCRYCGLEAYEPRRPASAPLRPCPRCLPGLLQPLDTAFLRPAVDAARDADRWR